MGSCSSKATGAPTQPGPVNTAKAASINNNSSPNDEDVSILFIIVGDCSGYLAWMK